MNIHIHTQYCENYGTASQPYWKFKGGDTYVVTGFEAPLDESIGEAGANAVASLRKQIEYTNNGAQQYILDWEFVEDRKLTEHEELQLKYDGCITYPSPRIALAPEAA